MREELSKEKQRQGKAKHSKGKAMHRLAKEELSTTTQRNGTGFKN